MLTWARIIELLLQFLNWCANSYDKKQQVKEAGDAQKEADKINNDPTSWFNEHFDSRMRNQETSKTANSSKAADNSGSK